MYSYRDKLERKFSVSFLIAGVLATLYKNQVKIF